MLSLLHGVEGIIEKGVEARLVLEQYKKFKEVVRSKGQERQIDRDFEEASGYSSYRVVKAAQEKQKGMIRFGN